MLMYWRELTVAWGESDPFGLVYYPRMLAWVNDTEHDLFRALGYPIDEMIRKDRTTFVMGEIHFRFIGPAAYGDRIRGIMTLAKVGKSTLHWDCKAINVTTGITVNEGRATRVYARINEDGTLSSASIPDHMRSALLEAGKLNQLGDPQ
jgi:acyl-CoA thioesterase FadM